MRSWEDAYRELDEEIIPNEGEGEDTIYLLKASLKTEKQLRDKLTDGGYAPRYADIGIDYAKSFGYIDDYRYAQYFVENYL